MKRVLLIRNIKAVALLSLAGAGFTSLSANPVWEVVPQKKDVRGQSTDSASVTERSNGYEVTLSMPQRDLSQVNVNFQDGVLHLDAPANGIVPSYHKEIPLSNSAADGELLIRRQDAHGLLIVTVPKPGRRMTALRHEALDDGQDQEDQGQSGYAIPSPRSDLAVMIGQMQRMQQEMDRMMGGMGFPDFPVPTMLQGMSAATLPDTPMLSMPSLEDHGDHYVVRASLPGHDLEKVNVSIKDQQLTIEANQQNRSRQSASSMSQESSTYSQAMSLPGPVQVGKMKVDHRGDELVVTLPKVMSDVP
jgi:HSP20 family molecular chaperone IbpA